MNEILDTVKPLALEICSREGYSLYDLEFVKGQNILRVYIDKEGGVDLEDCTTFSKGLNFLLDSEDPIETAYNLEVSSPGLERVLNERWHYEKQIQKKIRVVVKARTETSKELGKKNLEGQLLSIDELTFEIETSDGETVRLPFCDIHKCNVVFEGA